MAAQVEAVLIETTQLEQLKEFYKSGFELDEPDTSESDQVGFQIGSVYFGLEQVDEVTAASGAMSLWFKVDDASATYERLIECGARSKDAPSQIEDETIASVFDPDGNTIGLLSDRPVE